MSKASVDGSTPGRAQGAHDVLGAVRRQRTRRGRRGERLAHVRLRDLGKVDPQHLGRGAVEHQREPFDPVVGTRSTGCERPWRRRGGGHAQLLDERGDVVGHDDLCLEHRLRVVGRREAVADQLADPPEQATELQEVEEPAHLFGVDGAAEGEVVERLLDRRLAHQRP